MAKQLNLDEELKCSYCIPNWLRDEQIKQAIERNLPRLLPVAGERREPVAVVGFGPSLKDTWKTLKGFKYIITCSGSHKFLIEKGIIPTWHVEVDPRLHKVELLGEPHKDVEYLVASTCHAKYFDHLQGFNVKLWHVFDPNDDAIRMLPAGDWAVTGGCDVGLRAITLAAFLGFRKLHIFGIDGSVADGERHAAEHPNGKQKYSELEYEGKTYLTTAPMLLAAKQAFHELDQLQKVDAIFYGDGLVQAMARKYERKAGSGDIAYSKPELISPDYVALNAQLHRENLAFGVGGTKHADTVTKLMESSKSESVLDYGCGKGYLAKALPFPIWEYDPAIPGKQESPRPADLVICTDVLEHIEPDKIDFVLDDLKRCVKKLGYFTIHTGPAAKTLPDGRNTHLLQHDEKWWSEKLTKFFTVGKIFQKGPELYVLVAPLKKLKKKPKPETVNAETA
jgi:uncharacterized Rossmann fold enzyme